MIPEAQTKAQAERAETQIRQDAYKNKYEKAATKLEPLKTAQNVVKTVGPQDGFRYLSYEYLTLPPLEAAGFLLHRELPAVAGLTFAPQAFNVSVCPAATSILIPSSLAFLAAL